MYLYANIAHEFHTRIAYQRPRFLADSSLEWTPTWIQRRQLVLWAPKKNPDLVPSGANLKRSVPIAPAITGNDAVCNPPRMNTCRKGTGGRGSQTRRYAL